MNEPNPHDRARFVTAGTDDRELGLQWAAIRGRRPRLPSRKAMVFRMALVAAAGLALLAIALTRAPGGATPLTGTVLESGAQNSLILPDGARIALDGDGRVEVLSVDTKSVELVLDRGAATFDVPHRADRRLTVHAGDYDVLDRGTRFKVERRGAAVRVYVEEGSVQIGRTARQEPLRLVGAGEHWSSEPAPEPTASTLSTSVPSPASVPGAGEPSPAALNIPVPRAEVHSVLASGGPRELLDYADVAVRSGRPRDAALALDRLRRRFPRDARAGLAAFQLGRVRFDTFGDATGAAEAFESAIALAPSAPFREDAEARLVEALDVAGESAKCERARSAYLARHPSGVYLATVRSRCGSP